MRRVAILFAVLAMMSSAQLLMGGRARVIARSVMMSANRMWGRMASCSRLAVRLLLPTT